MTKKKTKRLQREQRRLKQLQNLRGSSNSSNKIAISADTTVAGQVSQSAGAKPQSQLADKYALPVVHIKKDLLKMAAFMLVYFFLLVFLSNNDFVYNRLAQTFKF